jgi:hypothetical protein
VIWWLCLGGLKHIWTKALPDTCNTVLKKKHKKNKM